MLTLGVAHRGETTERIRGPLREREIAVEHVSLTGETTPLGNPPESKIDVGLFFPSRILEGGVLAARLDVPWVNGREAILRSRNKAETLARLEAAGLPVPETVLVSDAVDRDRVTGALDRFDLPVVVKPNSASRGAGVLKVGDRGSLAGVSELFSLLHEFPATRDRSYLLQEYLPDARDYRIMVIDGSVVGAVERSLPGPATATGQWKHNVHRGATATGIEPADRHRELAERAAAVLEIPVLGVDILETDDRTVVLETNARPTIDTAAKYDPGFYDELAATIRKTARE
jgi:ribosomal protein S6--L-glutamate ligase